MLHAATVVVSALSGLEDQVLLAIAAPRLEQAECNFPMRLNGQAEYRRVWMALCSPIRLMRWPTQGNSCAQ